MFNSNTKGKVLFNTNNRKYPFLIRTPRDNGEDIYMLVKEDGTLSGDGFYKRELSKYCPKMDLSQLN